MRILITFICTLIVISGVSYSATQPAPKVDTVHLGYFEGGGYAIHDQLRDEYLRQLKNLLPDSIEAVFVPEGYRSAVWDRDTCRQMAAELVKVKSVDMVIAMGPWVVEDLLDAGFERPIIAMELFNPYLQGLIDSTGRPIAPNLTVQLKRDRPAADLDLANKLLGIKKLGFLYFPSGEERDTVLTQIRFLGRRLGFDVYSAEGYNNRGTFAFFKAYAELKKQNVDLIYVGPLWGLDLNMIRDFFASAERDRNLVMTWDGGFLCTRGASLSNGGYSQIPDAIFSARKTVRIINGETPAALPVVYNGLTGLTLNGLLVDNPRVKIPQEVAAQAHVVPSPPPENPTSYDLSTSVARVLSLNPGYLAQEDLLHAAAAAASASGSDYYPQIDLSASASLYDKNDSHNWQDAFSDDRYRATLRLRQTILSLETLRAMHTAELQNKSAQVRLDLSRLDLELAVATAYLDYLHADERRSVLTDYRNRIDRILELAHTREDLEGGRVSDRFRWEQMRHEGTAVVMSSENAVADARVAMNVLFNLPGNAEWVLEQAHMSKEQYFGDFDIIQGNTSTRPDEETLVDKLVSTALSENPIIESVDAELATDNSRLAEKSASQLPSIGFQARLNWADSLNEAVIANEKNTTWSLGAYLEVPIFDGFRSRREKAALRSQISALEFQRDHRRLEVMGRTRRQATRLFSILRQMPLLSAAAQRSDNNLALVMERYEQDQDALTDMIDAYRASRDAQLALVDNRFAAYQAMADLVHAMGISSFARNSSFRAIFLNAIKE
jgi:outer membrane protein TolC